MWRPRRSMRPKCLPRLQERLQPRQNPWPTFRVLRICRILLRPLIVRDHNLHRFSLRSQLYLDPRHYRPLAHAELVLEQRRCLHPQHLTRHIARRLAILAGPRPTHRPARLEVHVEIRAHKDGLVRLLRHKSVPDLLDPPDFRRRLHWQPLLIDTSFDFRTDASGKDPDACSPTLRQCHKLLWSKALPDGRLFDLDDPM